MQTDGDNDHCVAIVNNRRHQETKERLAKLRHDLSNKIVFRSFWTRASSNSDSCNVNSSRQCHVVRPVQITLFLRCFPNAIFRCFFASQSIHSANSHKGQENHLNKRTKLPTLRGFEATNCEVTFLLVTREITRPHEPHRKTYHNFIICSWLLATEITRMRSENCTDKTSKTLVKVNNRRSDRNRTNEHRNMNLTKKIGPVVLRNFLRQGWAIIIARGPLWEGRI